MTESVAAGNAALLYFDGIHLRPAGDRLFADIFVRQYGEIPPQLAHNAL
jgi:lysophospholipase L1-like esterase